MAAVRRLLKSKNPIRDMARYFMSSSWGVKNCFCNTCCNRSGNCCWEECSAIDFTLNDWYACYYSDAACTTPMLLHDLSDYVIRPPVGETKFRLFSAPGGTTNKGQGCEIDASNRQGQVWRTLNTHAFREFDITPGLPATCPPPTTETNAYLYVQYLHIEVGGTRWRWWISTHPESRISSGSTIYIPNVTEYRCCGADWDHADDCPSSGPYFRRFQYASIRPKSVTCCFDTTDSAHHADCGRAVDGKEPYRCPCINGGWGWDISEPDQPNCCASCEEDDCVDLPL